MSRLLAPLLIAPVICSAICSGDILCLYTIDFDPTAVSAATSVSYLSNGLLTSSASLYRSGDGPLTGWRNFSSWPRCGCGRPFKLCRGLRLGRPVELAVPGHYELDWRAGNLFVYWKSAKSRSDSQFGGHLLQLRQSVFSGEFRTDRPDHGPPRVRTRAEKSYTQVSLFQAGNNLRDCQEITIPALAAQVGQDCILRPIFNRLAATGYTAQRSPMQSARRMQSCPTWCVRFGTVIS